MINCPTCKAANPVNSKFCLECGASFASPCPRCGIELPPAAKFCNGCGHALRPASLQAPACGFGTSSPLSYTPRHLAEKILTSRAALEGELKQVTVLFSDVKGSMELAEQVDPEEWHGIMDRFFQFLADGVHRFEGSRPGAAAR